MLFAEQNEIIRQHQTTPPVKVVAIATALGLPVFSVATWRNEISGMIRRDSKNGGGSGYAIYVNAQHPRVRRRFTIAHEIAHFILHRNMIGDGIAEDAMLRAAGFSTLVEQQANAMAANILMPWHLLEPEMSQPGATIETLASLFEVSKDAMSIRILGVSYENSQRK